MKVATHDGKFHADDVFATALLKHLYPDVEIIRSRDPKILATADLRYDVGGKYYANTYDFDHHQAGFNTARPNGILYSSFGLLWHHLGSKHYRNPASNDPLAGCTPVNEKAAKAIVEYFGR